jgi:carboxyl-terminal processing protease
MTEGTKKRLNILMPIGIALIFIFGIQIGTRLGASSRVAGQGRDNSGIINEVLNYIDAKYVDTVNNNKLDSSAITGMLGDLDPHSVFIPHSELQGVTEDLEGNFQGIGIEFYIINDTINVISVIKGGPSEAAGLKPVDKIVTINDTLVAGKKINDDKVRHKLRGPKGTEVTVGIMREGTSGLLKITIKRGTIPTSAIDADYMVDPQVGYIKLNEFSATSYSDFMKALTDLQGKGMKKLILDLRGNPGGLLEDATEIADEFLDEDKLIVYTKGRVYPESDYKAHTAGLFEQGALVVLVDEGSASASEILSGAIQDWDRGTIVGLRTFGKGLVQEQYPLSDGSALRLTVARYYTPSGRCIQKPYDKGDEAYYNDIVNRLHHGELENADSIKFNKTEKFYTLVKHRVVYGGGGITPDIFVPLDTSYSNDYFTKVFRQGLITEFSYNYYNRNEDKLKQFKTIENFKSGFNVDDKLYDEFIAYGTKKGVTGTPEQIKLSSVPVRLQIKAHIARELWGQAGFYSIINDDDNTFKKGYQTVISLK